MGVVSYELGGLVGGNREEGWSPMCLILYEGCLPNKVSLSSSIGDLMSLQRKKRMSHSMDQERGSSFYL